MSRLPYYLLCLHLLCSLSSAWVTDRPIAPLLSLSDDATPLPGSYLVVFEPGTSIEHIDNVLDERVHSVLTLGDLVVCHVQVDVTDDKSLQHDLQRLPGVQYIEQDQIVRIDTMLNREELWINDEIPIEAPPTRAVSAQNARQGGDPWHLIRINHHTLAEATDATTFERSESDGKGVDVYILDSGIFLDHDEFSHGNAHWGLDATGSGVHSDELGHGTHIAAIVGGKTFGVASAAHLFAVKVLDEMGQTAYSTLIAGIHWTVQQAGKTGRKSIANLSVAGPISTVLNAALAAAYDAGVLFIVAAGNYGTNTCHVSPGSEPKAFKVAASNQTDQLPRWSNHGPCVNMTAPGVDILSASIGHANATAILEGTSMASPHVTGVAARLMSQYNLASPRAIADMLIKTATPACIKDGARGTPSRMLYTDLNRSM